MVLTTGGVHPPSHSGGFEVVQGQDLDFKILVGPFHLRTFNDSAKNFTFSPQQRILMFFLR